ncbi:MAG TPA: hypothetical protein VMZ05_11560 [Spirochaetota bacterium]|nr:hypothetical protein [Spirochaetota bacterium]
MKSAVQFGAGNIGRGFMGQLFWEIGYEIVFVDVKEPLVKLLNEKKSYTLRILDAGTRKKRDIAIDRFRALTLMNRDEAVEAIALSDVMSTAVGVEKLEDIAPLIVDGIKERFRRSSFPVDIYQCENSLHAAKILKSAVLDRLSGDLRRWAERNVGFIGTAVMRIVPAPGRFEGEDPLLVVSDAYHRLPYDNMARKSPAPSIEGLKPVDDFTAEMTKKLYTYNLAHAALGYLGNLKGRSYIHESFEDSATVSVVEGALNESMDALVKKYPDNIDCEEKREIIHDIKLRFSNPLIMDTIKRVGKNPVRKLGPDERLIGSAKLCLSSGILPDNISCVCAAALLYDDPEDGETVRLRRMVKEEGVEYTLKKISGVDPESRFGRDIVGHYNRLKTEKGR